MNKYYFTFGSNHLDKNGNSLGNRFVKINASNQEKARIIMFDARERKWAFQYDEVEFLPQIERYNLKEIGITEI